MKVQAYSLSLALSPSIVSSLLFLLLVILIVSIVIIIIIIIIVVTIVRQCVIDQSTSQAVLGVLSANNKAVFYTKLIVCQKGIVFRSCTLWRSCNPDPPLLFYVLCPRVTYDKSSNETRRRLAPTYAYFFFFLIYKMGPSQQSIEIVLAPRKTASLPLVSLRNTVFR